MTRLIGYAFAHLKNRAIASTTAIVLLLLAVASYPIQPQQRLLTLVLLGLLATATVLMRTIAQIDRNALLSRIANRTPNRVHFDRDFFALVGTYAGIPVLTLVVTGFPALGQQFSALLAWLSR